MGYQRPYPWIGAVVLELPLSLVVVALYVALSMMSVAETLGTVMGFVLFLMLVAAPVGNALVLRRLWRRWRPRANR